MNRALIKSFIPPIVLDALRPARDAPSKSYVSVGETVAAAKAAGLSLCDYRESVPNGPGPPGRRDRIIAKLAELGALTPTDRVCEIGAGTGMFLEMVKALTEPTIYDSYEIDAGWADYLTTEYGVISRPTDGCTLSSTPDASCGLVHAHGVLIYIRLQQILGYLREAIRVTKPGGYIVFDCFTEGTLADPATLDAWADAGHTWQVATPSDLLAALAKEAGLQVVAEIREPFCVGFTDYFVWRKP